MYLQKPRFIFLFALVSPLLVAWAPAGPLIVEGVETAAYDTGQIRAYCASKPDAKACEKSQIEQRGRFHLAWNSPVTSEMMRHKMIEIITSSKTSEGVDWQRASEAYFAFVKSGARMDFVRVEPPASTLSTTTTCYTDYNNTGSIYSSSGRIRTTCTTTRK